MMNTLKIEQNTIPTNVDFLMIFTNATVLLIIKTPPSIKATLAEIQKKVGIIKATRRDCARSARENCEPFWPILRGKRFKIGHFKAPKLTKILHFCKKNVVIIKATFGDLVKIPDFGP